MRRWQAGNFVSVEAEESSLLESLSRKRAVYSVADREHYKYMRLGVVCISNQ
jgi:hypothetical protein